MVGGSEGAVAIGLCHPRGSLPRPVEKQIVLAVAVVVESQHLVSGREQIVASDSVRWGGAVVANGVDRSEGAIAVGAGHPRGSLPRPVEKQILLAVAVVVELQHTIGG